MPEERKRRGHLFGPVPSRRLGRSLGVDLVPFKTCTFDCVYCQLGRTTARTLDRQAYVAGAAVVDELRAWADAGGTADYITLSGSGEPTLNSDIGEVIRGAREILPGTPVAVLTNGSLLWDAEVRAALAEAEVVLPSLDAARPTTFAAVNRPAVGLGVGSVVEGLRAAREELAAEMWLEVLLVRGVNDADADLEALRQAIDYIAPHRVQVNTVVRPPAEAVARPLGPAELAAAAEALGHGAEIIAPLPEGFEATLQVAHNEGEVLGLLRRRPCTLEDVAAGLGMHVSEAGKYVGGLVEAGRVSAVRRGGRTFYVSAPRV